MKESIRLSANIVQAKYDEDAKALALLQQLNGRQNITKDGKITNVYANIGNVDDVSLA